MSAVGRLFQRASALFSAGESKALTGMVHGAGAPAFGLLPLEQLLPATKTDYAKDVGDGLGSSVLMAPLNWMMRNFPEAPAIVEKRTGQEWQEQPDHALTGLLDQPNEYYDGIVLAMATVLDLCWGNAYWIKIRNANDEVVQLWWVPRFMMTPRWPSADRATFISHYDYFTGGTPLELQPRDVVHFRFGIDPRNIRLGLSPLGSLMRDAAMDDQAANFATAILKNLGVIGVVISPKEGAAAPQKKESLKETKEFVQEAFTGDRRGKALALGAPTEVQLLQYNMQGFDVSPLRDVSEERVCAALGIPAAVVGFGTGLQQTKVGATMKEMRQLAWTGGLMPLQKIIAKTITRSLLADSIWDGAQSYVPPTRRNRYRMRYDDKQVRALWEDAADKHNRVRADYLSGMISKGEARRETGRVAKPGDDEHFIQPSNVFQLDANGKPISASASSSTTASDSSSATDSPTED